MDVQIIVQCACFTDTLGGGGRAFPASFDGIGDCGYSQGSQSPESCTTGKDNCLLQNEIWTGQDISGQYSQGYEQHSIL